MSKIVFESLDIHGSFGLTNRYAYGWRLQQWDIPAIESDDRSLSKHEVLFKMFKSVNEDPRENMASIFADAYNSGLKLWQINFRK